MALMRGQEVSPADNEDLFDEAHWMAEMGGAGGGAQNKITSENKEKLILLLSVDTNPLFFSIFLPPPRC